MTRHSAIISAASPCGTRACAEGLRPGGTYLSLSRVTELCTSFILPPGMSPKSGETGIDVPLRTSGRSLESRFTAPHLRQGQTGRQEARGQVRFLKALSAQPSNRVCSQSLGKGCESRSGSLCLSDLIRQHTERKTHEWKPAYPAPSQQHRPGAPLRAPASSQRLAHCPSLNVIMATTCPSAKRWLCFLSIPNTIFPFVITAS